MHFGLLISFLTLMVTGVVSYLFPFSIINTRIHIVFAAMTLFFVGYHLIHKYVYFSKAITHTNKRTRQLILLVLCVGTLVFVGAIQNAPPASLLMDGSYEARHQKEILRASPYTATQFIDNKVHTVRTFEQNTEQTNKQVALDIEVRLPLTQKYKPAIAIWAESTTGALIETLYLSPELAYSDSPTWHGHKVKRNQVLPIWRSRFTLVSGLAPNGDIDASTGATDTHRFSLAKYFEQADSEYLIFFEINQPFDTNSDWTNKILGQPSVVYSAYMEHSDLKTYAILELTGHGGSEQAGGELHYNLDTITTAKQLVELVLVAGAKLEPSKNINPSLPNSSVKP